MTCDRCGSRCHGRLCAECESIEALERATEFDAVDEDADSELRDDEAASDAGRDSPVYHVVCRDCEFESIVDDARLGDTVSEDARRVVEKHREWYGHDVEAANVGTAVVTDGGVWGRNVSGYLSAETCPKCGGELQYQGHHGQLQCLSEPSHTFTHLRNGSGTHWLADADGETSAKTTIADEAAPHSGGGSR
ncbi:hypothetical protein [Halobaculum litoreum]|uniref:hypothetical protein n=1 Tax=Halobaculum litoreum TaxID=3031998 RepID=UPI0024C3C43E|nr:hypothetical protein [Halobaculum sp. DT92]